MSTSQIQDSQPVSATAQMQYPNHILSKEDYDHLKRRAQNAVQRVEENTDMSHDRDGIFATLKKSSLVELEEAELGYAYRKRHEAFSALASAIPCTTGGNLGDKTATMEENKQLYAELSKLLETNPTDKDLLEMHSKTEKLIAQLEENREKRFKRMGEVQWAIGSACSTVQDKFDQCSAEHKQLLRQAGHKTMTEMISDDINERKKQYEES